LPPASSFFLPHFENYGDAIMTNPEMNSEVVGSQLGAGGVDTLVTNAERICMYEQQRIELVNRAPIVGLQGEYNLLLSEEKRIEERLRFAPPPGDLRRLRRRAIFSGCTAVMLTIAGFMFTLLTFAPFRLGWKSWLYSLGIAVVTPFLVEYLLNFKSMEKVVKPLTAVAAIAGVASLMLLAVIRGDLLAQEIHQDAAPVIVIDDSVPQPEPQNTFYDSTIVLLRVAMLLMAFTMEAGAGLALREAWRSVPDSSEDWNALRNELVSARERMSEILVQATMLRNEPEIFVNRFWRDFYYALLSNAARSAMTKLLVLMLGISFLASSRAEAEDRLNMVVAIDLTRSVAGAGPDGKTDFQKNVEGVARLLAQVPAGARITVIGITDHSFVQPYILLSARVPDDAGYFGEKLVAAHGQLVLAWKTRSSRLDPHFRQTDILGALQLASDILSHEPNNGSKVLVIFSDMRQSTPDLNLESTRIVPSFSTATSRRYTVQLLQHVQVDVLGADGAGKSDDYWQSLKDFWTANFHTSGANLDSYSALRNLQLSERVR
jgi:hypothetical protein